MSTRRRRTGRPTELNSEQVLAVRRALRALLALHGGNASAVAERIGRTQSAVSQLKRRRNRPSRATARSIARALRWPLAAVLGEVATPQS